MPTTSVLDVVPFVEASRDDVDVVATALRLRRSDERDDGDGLVGVPMPDAASGVLAHDYNVDLNQVLTRERASGRPGAITRVPVLHAGLPRRWLLVGVGDGSALAMRQAGAALGRATQGADTVATSLVDGADALATRSWVEGFLLGAHRQPFTGTADRSDNAPAGRLRLTGRVRQAAVDAGRRHAEAGVLARDLSAVPASVKTPSWMVQQARDHVDGAGRDSGLHITVLEAKELAEQGFGGLLAVGGGSASPPALVRIDYTPAAEIAGRGGRIVLVGKGITFDTGGISLKPRASMVTMKTDMAGAAAVLAAVVACPAERVRRPVTALLALAENHLSGSSYRPSDVVTIYGGRTVEVGNTDAEGRMVLADALAYAATQLDPAVLIDVATLTGAASIALGRRDAPLFTPDDALAAALLNAGAAAGERLWRLPLVSDYLPAIESAIADTRQVPERDHWGGGSITPALFLRSFTAGLTWAHLDIAGVGRSAAVDHEIGKGPTGFGARLLLRWLATLR